MIISGITIKTNPNLVVPGETKAVKRTWRERLFSRPWRPLQTHNYIQTYDPDPNFYDIGGVMFCHPVLLDKLVTAIEASKK